MAMSLLSPRKSIAETVFQKVGGYYSGSGHRRCSDGCMDEDGTMELVQIGAERTKNVLILMSDTGGGHRASAEAIRDAFQSEFGDEYRVIGSILFWVSMGCLWFCLFALLFLFFLLLCFSMILMIFHLIQMIFFYGFSLSPNYVNIIKFVFIKLFLYSSFVLSPSLYFLQIGFFFICFFHNMMFLAVLPLKC